ncbi:MerR family transcriptional regulator [Bacillus halotolerans]|uniref:MerR family transcriptional regulator n=1 Tax=Bacillus halotolerans TaxID=260554 RepID=UPI002DBF3B15|nr:MerR family transcriptional regulator [Bacillus halotolerans]MEC1661668.1 MerR family transcriptional regulator [Bacillus halotolerans]
MMKKFLSIGDMSKLNNVSIQTLRYYDKIGLFKPEYVNPDNHYRYYSVRQIFYLDIIKYLKHIGTSLEEIRSIIALPPESIYEFLKKQELTIEEQMKKIENIHQSLKHHKSQLHEQILLNNQEHGVVYTRKIDERLVLKVDCKDTVTPLDQPDIYFRELADALEKEGTVVDIQYGCIYPLKHYESTEKIHYSSLYTNISKTDLNSTGVSVDSIPKGTYMCIAFKWSKADYYDHFNKLKKAYFSSGFPIENDVYEVSLPNNYASSNEEDFITELQIQID